MNKVPDEVLVQIFSHIHISTLFALSQVCCRWRRLITSFYFERKNQSNWRTIAETFINSGHLSEFLKHAPRFEKDKDSEDLSYVPMSVSRNPHHATGKSDYFCDVDWDAVVDAFIRRRSIQDSILKRTNYIFDEVHGSQFDVASVSGEIVLIYCQKQRILSMISFEGDIINFVCEDSVKVIRPVVIYSGHVELSYEAGSRIAYHDHFFVLTENGLIKLKQLSKMVTVGVITSYRGLQITDINFDINTLYVYDVNYGISTFSVNDLQRQKRLSVDGLSSYYVANETLVYVEDSGKYHNPLRKVGFSYSFLPFGVNMVNYVTPMLKGEELVLEGYFECKIFHLDCILITASNNFYLTVDGENYRSLELKHLPGRILSVCVNGPTIAAGLDTGKVLIYYVNNTSTLMCCNLDEPLLAIPAIRDLPVHFLVLFDTNASFGLFASDGKQICTCLFSRPH